MDTREGRDAVPPCQVHVSSRSAGTCRSCGAECCEDCLVFSFGEAKAPFCPSCALTAAGLHRPAAHRIDASALR